MKPLVTVFALLGLATPALAADGDTDLAAGLAPETVGLDLGAEQARTPPSRGNRSSTAGRSSSSSSRSSTSSSSSRSSTSSSRSSSSSSSASSRSATTSRSTSTSRPTARPPAPRAPVARAPAAPARPTAARPPASRAPVSRAYSTPAPRPTAARPPASRPGSASTARPPARPGSAPPVRAHRPHRVTPRHVHHPHYGPGRHIRPVHRTVVVRHYRPWHGVFVYGPRPMYHGYYGQPQAPRYVEEEHLPERKVDREGSVALGLRSGSYLTGYEGGSSYGDFGLGLVGRWRPDEAVGLELAVQHHDETWNSETERAQTLAQGSVMLFANPWGRVQPYVLGGLSANKRNLDDAYIGPAGGAQVLQTEDTLWGPHAGAGIEFAFGKKAALDLELRYVGWMNAGGDDPSVSGALQTNAGFLVHF